MLKVFVFFGVFFFFFFFGGGGWGWGGCQIVYRFSSAFKIRCSSTCDLRISGTPSMKGTIPMSIFVVVAGTGTRSVAISTSGANALTKSANSPTLNIVSVHNSQDLS